MNIPSLVSALPSEDQIQQLLDLNTYDKNTVLKQFRHRAYKKYLELVKQPKTQQFLPLPTINWNLIVAQNSFSFIANQQLDDGIFLFDFASFCAQYPRYSAHILRQVYSDPIHALIDAVSCTISVLYISSENCGTFNIDTLLNNKSSIDKYIIVLEKNAQITLTHTLNQNDLMHNFQAITVILDQHAQLTYQYQAKSTIIQYTFWSFYFHENSTLKGSYWLSAQEYAHYEVHCNFIEQHADAQMRMGYELSNAQHMNIVTKQQHSNAKNNSDIKVRGVLYETAQSSYNGRIQVDKGAINTEACLEHKNILKGKNARSWAVPSLEVETNQVHCSHGSAIGNLDIDQLLYAMCRGIDIKEAEKLLITGFFNEIGLQL